MTQVTKFVNCPHCGKIVEVVCPDEDKQPKKVTADISNYFSMAQTNNNLACPFCHNRIFLHWYY